MQYQDKKKLAYLAGLSILFGSVELFIPKILPFFRLGLANIPMLLALDLGFPSFMILALLKALGNSYIAGNIFSFFVLVSIAQSLSSAFIMYLANKTKFFSRYGISLSGALVSSIVQLAVASLYVGNSVFAFLPLMLIISFFSALLVAYLASKLDTLKVPDLKHEQKNEKPSTALISMIALSAIAIMLIDNPLLLLIAFLSALILQKSTGRKILILPHLAFFAAMVFCSLIAPEGRILLEIGSFKITEGALISGTVKALRLSGTIALSQAYSSFLRPGDNLLGETLRYFTLLFSAFKKSDGKLEERILKTLSLETIEDIYTEKKKVPSTAFAVSTVIFISISILNFVLF